MPWRKTRDPYAIWLSEVILQQTRVNQGMSYFHAFLERFPTVNDLAAAQQDDVLETWQGLGYYSRARNLHATAKQIVNEFNGVFPSRYADLLLLKGIGPYTAAAISSFAFGEDQAAVDGNVIRVVSRLFSITEDVRLPKVQSNIKELAQGLLPIGQSYTFNQAMMELGATVCTPGKPRCMVCPVVDFCEAHKAGIQATLPVKSALRARRTRYLNYLLLEFDGALLFKKRGPKDIWEGLYEPLLMESEHSFSSASEFWQFFPEVEELALEAHFYPVSKHILSHQELRISLLRVVVSKSIFSETGIWIPLAEVQALPKPVVFSKILGLKKGTALPLAF